MEILNICIQEHIGQGKIITYPTLVEILMMMYSVNCCAAGDTKSVTTAQAAVWTHL
jgi:hypothetical protein